VITPGSRGVMSPGYINYLKMPLEPVDSGYYEDLHYIDWEIEKKKKVKDKRLIEPKEDLPPKL
jgi:hypothetical protein